MPRRTGYFCTDFADVSKYSREPFPIDGRSVMEVLADSTRLFDPYRYVRAADMAVADGDPDRAINLIEEAYMVFDLCLAACTHARCRDEVANGKK